MAAAALAKGGHCIKTAGRGAMEQESYAKASAGHGIYRAEAAGPLGKAAPAFVRAAA
jgi:hypothetical protein